MNKWKTGEPRGLGWYVVEFAEGDRFGVVNRRLDNDRSENRTVIENGNDGGYITDPIIAHYQIPDPITKENSMFNWYVPDLSPKERLKIKEEIGHEKRR
jgi:hypothetical protein